MKKLVAFVFILLVALTSQAQVIPEWLTGDYVGTAGPIDVQIELLDYHVPWSVPTQVKRSVMFGEVSFWGSGGVDITVNSVASIRCVGGFCFAYNEVPVYISQVIPWSHQYGTYISLWGDPLIPSFSAFAVDISVPGDPSALWASGTFYDDAGAWMIHETATYTLYGVYQRTIPVVAWATAVRY